MTIGKQLEPPRKCKICGSEMEQLEPGGKWECPSTHLHKPAYMSWMGQYRKHVQSVVKFDGVELTDRKVRCRCGETVDVSKQVDFHAGGALLNALRNLEDYANWKERNMSLQETARQGKLMLDNYIEEQERLNVEYARNQERFTSQNFDAGNIPISCDKCGATLGIADVSLSLINSPEIPFLTRGEVNNLPISQRMFARISKDWRFGNVEELRRYMKAQDLLDAKKIISQCKEKLDTVTLPYEILRLFNFEEIIRLIDGEVETRKRDVADAVIKIVKERVPAIM